VPRPLRQLSARQLFSQLGSLAGAGLLLTGGLLATSSSTASASPAASTGPAALCLAANQLLASPVATTLADPLSVYAGSLRGPLVRLDAELANLPTRTTSLAASSAGALHGFAAGLTTLARQEHQLLDAALVQPRNPAGIRRFNRLLVQAGVPASKARTLWASFSSARSTATSRGSAHQYQSLCAGWNTASYRAMELFSLATSQGPLSEVSLQAALWKFKKVHARILGPLPGPSGSLRVVVLASPAAMNLPSFAILSSPLEVCLQLDSLRSAQPAVC